MQEVVVGALNPFVASALGFHSLSAAVTIVSSIIGGITKLPLAKILDLWGRPQGLTIMLIIWVLGFIMTASAHSIETYAAANVFFSVGAQGVSYCVTIFIADTSTLRNRPLALAFATSPYIITPWMAGPIADSVRSGLGWRWGFGIFAIVIPFVVLPLSALFLFNHHKAKKMGLIESKPIKITPAKVYQFCVEIDLVGILLLAVGWVLFLLPFSLWSYQAQKWQSPIVICFWVFGVLCLISFIVWEKFFAPVTFIPYKLLMNRTVLFGGFMFTFNFCGGAIWRPFFSSMLMVIWNPSLTNATYISRIYRVGSCFAALVLGYFMRKTSRFKWVATLYALPLMILAVGLLIHFSHLDKELGYIIMCQIFIACAGGPLVVAGEMAMMAPSDHQHIAVIIAILDLFCSIGSAIGGAIASAIWTGTFPNNLAQRLPAGAPIAAIYKSLDKQLSYRPGSVERIAIAESYSASQRYMFITSVVMMVCAWGCSWMWSNIKVRDKKQVEGLVV